MIRVLPVVNAPAPTAHDGFGSRTNGIDSETGDEVGLLDLSSELIEHSGFVAALGERVARFAAVRHASYVHLRRLDRPSADRLELVSDHTPGWRLSELLSASHAAGIPVDITIVIGLMRQLLPAVALYGRHNRDAAIGALAVERLIVTPQGRLVIAEHAFGPALEKLNLGRDKLWRQLRVTMPPSAGLPRSNQRADANAVGVVALSLLLGRVLDVEEFPAQLPALVEGLQEYRAGQASPLSASFAGWLTRALQFDVRTAFQAPSEAQLAFESVLASDRSYVTTNTKLEEWLGKVAAPAASASVAAVEPAVAESPAAIEAPSADPVLEPETRPAPKTPLLAMAAVIVTLVAVVGWLMMTRDTGGHAGGRGRACGAVAAAGRARHGGRKRAGRHPVDREIELRRARARSPGRQVGNHGVIPLTIQAGVQTSQYIELQGVTATGTLEIRSEPSGARVTIDGQPRGTTPATVRELSAGEHTVVVESGSRKATQNVKIEAGSTAQLVVPLPRR